MPAVSAPEGCWARSAAVTGGGAGLSLPLGRPVEAVAPCRGWGSLLRAEEAGRGGLHPVHFSNLIWGLGKREHPFSSWPQSACLSANLGGLRFLGSLLPGGALQNVLPGCCGEGGGGGGVLSIATTPDSHPVGDRGRRFASLASSPPGPGMEGTAFALRTS